MEPAHQYDLDDTDPRFADLVHDLEAGNDVLLTHNGEPLGQVIPLRPGAPLRRPGGWEGKVVIHDDFDELDAETLAAFNGERP